MPNYDLINICRSQSNPRTKRSSGGLICYIHKDAKGGITQLSGKCKSDDRLWLKLCSSFFGLTKDIYLCLLYISPPGSTHTAFRDNLWNLLEEGIAFCSRGHILLAGDFNARITREPDFIEHDTNGYVPLPQDYVVDISSMRASQDTHINSYVRLLLQLCAGSELRIVNGRRGSDQVIGSFTCFNSRGHSVVDYFISSASLLQEIGSFIIDDITTYSDHCSLQLDLPTCQSSSYNLMQLRQKSLDLLAGSVGSSPPYSTPNTIKSSPKLVTSPELHSVFLDPEFTTKLS